jgi:hypothetical protein
MNSLNKFSVAAVLAVLFLALVPAVKADDANWPTEITFNEPIQVGDLVLTPGTYIFQLVPGAVCRDVVMVYSLDRKQWEGMIMGVRAYRTKALEKSSFTFEDIGKGSPKALQYWFYPDWNYGIEFVYPHS